VIRVGPSVDRALLATVIDVLEERPCKLEGHSCRVEGRPR
jgi:hypothetical protein